MRLGKGIAVALSLSPSDLGSAGRAMQGAVQANFSIPSDGAEYEF
jgi:hypothetical protein